MEINCADCRAALIFDDDKIPEKGATAKCPECSNILFLNKDINHPPPLPDEFTPIPNDGKQAEKTLDDILKEDTHRKYSKRQFSNFAMNLFSNLTTSGTQWFGNNIFCGQFIPNKKMVNALQEFAMFDLDSEKPIILIDDTVFGSGKKGVLITDSNLFFGLETNSGNINKGILSLSQITKFEINTQKQNISIWVNDKHLGNLNSLSPNDADLLNIFFNKFLINDFNISSQERQEITESRIDPKILQRIREYMIEGERILYVAWGLDSITARDFIVCTTHRLIIIDREFFGLGENIREFEYDIITSIGIKKEGTGILDTLLKQCQLEIFAAGSEFKIDTLQRSEAEQIIKIARNQKNKQKQSTETTLDAKPTAKNIAGEIKELKELLDCGALTQDEFDTAKGKLLTQI